MNGLTHNGKFTVISPTGDHRTFKIKTQPDHAKFAAGERIVSVLEGSDYERFGFVNLKGIAVWKKWRGEPGREKSIYEGYADLLTRQDYWESRGFMYEMSVLCRVCNRELTTPESLASGIGPICEARKK